MRICWLLVVLTCICHSQDHYSGNVGSSHRNPHTFGALTTDGSFFTWGLNGQGSGLHLTNISTAFSTHNDFFALRKNGTVFVSNKVKYGGMELLTNVVSISTNQNAAAALLANGTVKAFGNVEVGGQAPDNINNVKLFPVASAGFWLLA